MQKHGNIASEVGELILIHLQGGELENNSPPIQQSDWSIVTSHGTICENHENFSPRKFLYFGVTGHITSLEIALSHTHIVPITLEKWTPR